MSLKTAYFDCAFGAAGDMLVGACIDCGVTQEYIEGELKKLNLPVESFTITAGKVHRASIYATKFDVWIDHKADQRSSASNHEHGHEHDDSNGHEHSHSEGHTHSHSHSQAGAHSHSHSQAHSHSHEQAHDQDHGSSPKPSHDEASRPGKPERALSEILKIISQSTLDQAVKELASRIFERLGRAESSVHGVPQDQIHFHEVGAVDAICDIVGFAIAYTKLGIEVSYVSPLPLGSGTVHTRHGQYPVPGPAVLALLREAGAMTASLALPYECLTPTGAAILCTIGANFGPAKRETTFMALVASAALTELPPGPAPPPGPTPPPGAVPRPTASSFMVTTTG